MNKNTHYVKTLVTIVKNCIVMFGIYVVQFILFPTLIPIYYPRSTESTFIFVITVIIGSILGICFISGKIKFWLIPDFLYGLLILIYSGKGLYGFGLYGITLDGLQPKYDYLYALISVVILIVFLFIVQIIIVVLKNILHK